MHLRFGAWRGLISRCPYGPWWCNKRFRRAREITERLIADLTPSPKAASQQMGMVDPGPYGGGSLSLCRLRLDALA